VASEGRGVTCGGRWTSTPPGACGCTATNVRTVLHAHWCRPSPPPHREAQAGRDRTRSPVRMPAAAARAACGVAWCVAVEGCEASGAAVEGGGGTGGGPGAAMSIPLLETVQQTSGPPGGPSDIPRIPDAQRRPLAPRCRIPGWGRIIGWALCQNRSNAIQERMRTRRQG
jgi:hypothetical protein